MDISLGVFRVKRTMPTGTRSRMSNRCCLAAAINRGGLEIAISELVSHLPEACRLAETEVMVKMSVLLKSLCCLSPRNGETRGNRGNCHNLC